MATVSFATNCSDCRIKSVVSQPKIECHVLCTVFHLAGGRYGKAVVSNGRLYAAPGLNIENAMRIIALQSLKVNLDLKPNIGCTTNVICI